MNLLVLYLCQLSIEQMGGWPRDPRYFSCIFWTRNPTENLSIVLLQSLVGLLSRETLKWGGPLVFWVSKFMPKSGKLVFILGEKKVVVKTVWVLKYAYPAQQKLCSENLHLFLHLEAIPTTKKNTGGNLRILKARGAAGGRSREHFRPKTPKRPPFGSPYNDNYVSCLSVNWHDVWRHVGLSDAKNSDE